MTSTNPLTSYFSNFFNSSSAAGNTGNAAGGSSPLDSASSDTASPPVASAANAQVSAQVEAMLAKQNTVAPRINAQLTADQTKLSALGQLQSALATFQTVAQSVTASGLSAAASSSATSADSSTVPEAQDKAQIAANVGRLVNAYNTLNEQLTNLKQGDLKTTNAVRNIQNQLASIFPFGADNSGAGSDTGITLATLGITRQGNGDLALDSGKLQAAVNSNADGVSKFFSNGSSGVADKLVSALGAVSGQGGSVKQAIAGVNADIGSLTEQKAQVEAAMTAKGNALMKFYTDQANGSNPTASILDGISTPSGSTGTLLDLY